MRVTRSMRLRDQRGMTLMELMMALTVMGILFAIAIPTIQLQIARQELRAAGREVVEVLRGSRDAAINEGVPRYVLFRPEDDPVSYQVYRFDGTSWVPGRNKMLLDASVTFTDSDITLPALSGVPVAGAPVPANAAYFGTRGRYPAGHNTYAITLRGRMGRTIELTFYAQTGQVTNP